MWVENRTILIVDDEPEALQGYRDFLAPARASGTARKSSRRSSDESAASPSAAPTEEYRILSAETGERAVGLVREELAQGRRIAAGFFDVKLGTGMDGLSTIQAIRALDPDIRCVVVTAYHDRTVEEIHKLFGEEFKDRWDYLNKPFTQGEIVQKARQMVGAWNRERLIEAMNAQLIRSERLAAVGQVARGVGHEFGNILLRVVGKTDLALLENDVKRIHDHLRVVMTAAERAGVIVRNLQTFSRTEPSLRVGSLIEPIEEAASLISHELTKASIKLEKRFGSVPDVRIDRGEIAQVVLNLVINAIHAMSKGGALTLSVEAAPGPGGAPGVALRIADTGGGIPADVLPRIFDFAFTTKGDRGSGLGLSISRQIIEAHGGEIAVATTSERGTEFRIWLPASGVGS